MGQELGAAIADKNTPAEHIIALRNNLDLAYNVYRPNEARLTSSPTQRENDHYSAIANEQLRQTNSLAIALGGPVFGALPSIGRALGASPQTVQGLAILNFELGMLATGVRIHRPVTPQITQNLRIPQGLSESKFRELSLLARTRANELGLGDNLVIQGSRAIGNAKVKSDIDIAIRVSPEKFNSFLNTQSRLANPNPGSNLFETRRHAIETGKIQRGDARLSTTAKQIEKTIGLKVDFSVIKKGGRFDNVPERRGRYDDNPQIKLLKK